MVRPVELNFEKIVEWDQIINNDKNLPPGFATEPLLIEVLYASFWMAEGLKKEGCPDEIIVRIQYTMGQLSFGHDPWQIAQEMLEAYKNNEMEFEIDYNEDDA